MDKNILDIAKGAKSPEELLKIAGERGISDFNEESAKVYFDLLCKSGELSDQELETASGGGCAVKKGERKVVTVLNSCGHWRCNRCNCGETGFGYLDRKNVYLDENQLSPCNPDGISSESNIGKGNHKHNCSACYYCSYEGALWLCNNPTHNKE